MGKYTKFWANQVGLHLETQSLKNENGFWIMGAGFVHLISEKKTQNYHLNNHQKVAYDTFKHQIATKKNGPELYF